jgi:hypothetical protein
MPDSGWVTVAVLGKARGIRGEITALPLSGKPERFQNLRGGTLYTASAAPCRRGGITWFHDRTLILKFRGVDSISDAEPLAGAEVRVPLSERTPLEPGEFFQSDLIGCEVVDRRRANRWAAYRLAGWRRLRPAGTLGRPADSLRAFHLRGDRSRRAAHRRGLPEGLKEVNRP